MTSVTSLVTTSLLFRMVAAMDMSGMDSSTMSTSTNTTDSMTTTTTTTTMTMGLFHTGFGDSLFWTSWAPTSPVAYAFTFLALVVLGIASRAVKAYTAQWEFAKQVEDQRRPDIIVQNEILPASNDDKVVWKGPDSSTHSVTNDAGPFLTTREINPWRLSTDVPRGLFHFVSQGLGYLLMLAVMTGNVGYFFAVLSGIFIGEVAFGRLAHHHSSTVRPTQSTQSSASSQTSR